ncbi:MAG: hypothetical protein M1387_11200 [Thaumarchaeota archaeon]|nr:hypothetical protein [Nitrososphaerota archaeon]
MAKVGLAERFRFVTFQLVTTEAVYREVVEEGIRKGISEAEGLEDLFKAGVIKIEKANERIDDNSVLQGLEGTGIHLGKERVIALALELQSTVVMDDQRARQVAKILGVRVAGTPHLILHMVGPKLLTRSNAEKAIDTMIEKGWRCGPSHYSEILKLISKA